MRQALCGAGYSGDGGHVWERTTKLLWQYFCGTGAVVAEECNILPGELVNPRRKSPAITEAREVFVAVWRQNVGQRYAGKGLWEARIFLVDEPHPDGWEPISFPNLARVLGMDHSALVLAYKRWLRRQGDDEMPFKAPMASATGSGGASGG